MRRTVNAQAARQRLGELLEGVFYRDDEVVIERAGKPMGVVISPQRFAAIEAEKEAARERFFQMVQELWEQNKDADPEEVQRAVDEAVASVRRERRERRRADAASPEVAEERVQVEA